MSPAPSLRATIPTARRMATPTKSPRTAHRIEASISPVSKAGMIACSVDHPSTQASATVSAPNRMLPRVEAANTHGSLRIATPRTRKPSRIVDARAVLDELTDFPSLATRSTSMPTLRVTEQFLWHFVDVDLLRRSEEHTSELQSLMRLSSAVF